MSVNKVDSTTAELTQIAGNGIPVVDSTPTSGSENPVSSGGTFDAINDVYVTNGILGAKNLIPFNLDVIKAQNTGGTWSNNVFTFRDVSYTFNDDGSIVVNGTAPSSNNSIITLTGYDLVLPKAGEYKLVCSENTDTEIDWIYLYDVTTSSDLANSTSINFTYNGTDLLVLKYMVRSGQTVTNKTLHPMILVQNDTDSTYQPYAMTNQELTSQISNLNNRGECVELARLTNYESESYYTTSQAISNFRFVLLCIVPSSSNYQFLATTYAPTELFQTFVLQADYASGLYNAYCRYRNDNQISGLIKSDGQIGILYGIK